MNWYYVLNNERQGPVDQAGFDELARQGVITPTTLVWREGMAEWRAYGEIVAPSAPMVAAPPPPVPAGSVVCSQCGQVFPPDNVIRLGSGYVCAACKPIATQKLREGVLDANSSEQIRKDHLQHEASVKSIGFLYFLSSAFLLLASIGMFISASARNTDVTVLLVSIFMFIIGGALVWVGIGLRKLRPWARIPSGILSGLGLLGFPLGTLINGYILYLLFSKKGKVVFSPEYQHIIEETPHIKYRTSIVVWIFLGLLLLLLGLGMLGLLVRSTR